MGAFPSRRVGAFSSRRVGAMLILNSRGPFVIIRGFHIVRGCLLSLAVRVICSVVRVPERVFHMVSRNLLKAQVTDAQKPITPEDNDKDCKERKIDIEYHYWVCSRPLFYLAIIFFTSGLLFLFYFGFFQGIIFFYFGFFRISDVMIGHSDAEIRQPDK